MVIRHGRSGDFLGCSKFPKCRGTRSMPTGVKCPKDGGEIAERRSKKRGKAFYGCENYPNCDFVVWDKPVAETCPECGYVGPRPRATRRAGASGSVSSAATSGMSLRLTRLRKSLKSRERHSDDRVTDTTAPVHIVGGGLAGSEAAWQLAERGHEVILHEMRPVRGTAAHRTERPVSWCARTPSRVPKRPTRMACSRRKCARWVHSYSLAPTKRVCQVAAR